MTDLATLNADMVQCVRCPLSLTRKHVVPGEGPENAEILFIGEAPGYNEDQRARPFIGPAGQLLNDLIESIGMRREDVFITNIVKCRPPNNRDPQPVEIDTCRPWLESQLDILTPLVICTLGRFSMGRYFKGTISKIHGQAEKFGDLWVMPLYHPAAALHQQALRPQLFEDIARVPKLLERARAERVPVPPPALTQQPANAEPDQKQLNLF